MTKEYELHLFLFQGSLQPLPNPVFSVIENTGSLQLYVPFPTHYLGETGGDSHSLYMHMNPNAQVSEKLQPHEPGIPNGSYYCRHLSPKTNPKSKTGNVFRADLNLLS